MISSPIVLVPVKLLLTTAELPKDRLADAAMLLAVVSVSAAPLATLTLLLLRLPAAWAMSEPPLTVVPPE